MCTNFTPTKKSQWVKEKLGVDLPAEYPTESYTGFGAPVVVKSHQTGQVACGLAKFGLIPAWAKDERLPVIPTTLEVKLLQRSRVTEQLGVNVSTAWCSSITSMSPATNQARQCVGRLN